MRFRKFLKPYKTRGSSFREHTIMLGGNFHHLHFVNTIVHFPMTAIIRISSLSNNRKAKH